MSTLVDFSTEPLVSTFVDVSTERVNDVTRSCLCRPTPQCYFHVGTKKSSLDCGHTPVDIKYFKNLKIYDVFNGRVTWGGIGALL